MARNILIAAPLWVEGWYIEHECLHATTVIEKKTKILHYQGVLGVYA
jgi:hypothetical protein